MTSRKNLVMPVLGVLIIASIIIGSILPTNGAYANMNSIAICFGVGILFGLILWFVDMGEDQWTSKLKKTSEENY